MIPKEYIDAYKSIKAPETLHECVTASASSARRRRILPRLITVAASLVIVTAAVAFIALRTGGSDIRAYVAYNGQPVDASVAISMNAVSDIKNFSIGAPIAGGIRLEVHVNDTTTVTVSDGTVTLVDDNGIAIDTGSLLTLSDDKNKHIVHWLADFYKISESDPFSLVLENSQGSVTYTLKPSDGMLTLTKESKN